MFKRGYLINKLNPKSEIKMESKKKCQKIIFQEDNEGTPKILYGIIISEDEVFLTFQTARRIWRISKTSIKNIQSTNLDFVGGEQDEK